jgi:CheY-like chemotaxis protein/anti-sigma regulatory factor (Ser/Thr protein kinase)
MPSVLIVDDSPVERRLLCEYLRTHSEWRVYDAANGEEALARVAEASVDLVVTDLNMPVMDGLELVTAMRTHYPHIPVILITAYGSEALAVEALERGAAGYVPKSRLTEKLLPTMENVLALARADQSYARLIQCLDLTEFRFQLENDLSLVDPLVDLVQQMVEGLEFSDFTGRLRIGIALREALLNAILHGNLELSPEEVQRIREASDLEKQMALIESRRQESPYKDRRVYVQAVLTRVEVRFVVRDEGPGFNPELLPNPTDLGALDGDRGRGLALMRTFMDKVVYNDKGNEVSLVKYRETPPRTAAQS